MENEHCGSDPEKHLSVDLNLSMLIDVLQSLAQFMTSSLMCVKISLGSKVKTINT